MSNQEQQPAPSGLGQVLPIVQAVIAIVPRWLVAAAGVIFLTWLGFDLYNNAQQTAARTIIENQNAQVARELMNVKKADPSRVNPAFASGAQLEGFLRKECSEGNQRSCEQVKAYEAKR
jgi:hypothetical protein